MKVATRTTKSMGGPQRPPVVVLAKAVFQLPATAAVVLIAMAVASEIATAEPSNVKTARTPVHVAGPTAGPYAELTRDIEIGVRTALRHLAVPFADGDIVLLADKCGLRRVTSAAPVPPAIDPAGKLRIGDGADIDAGLNTISNAIVIGHPCARAAIAAAKAYAIRNQLFIAPVTRHPDLTDDATHTTTLRLTGRDDVQGRFAGQYLARHFSAQDVVVVHDRTRFSKRLVAQVVTAWPLLPARKAAISDEFAGRPRDMPSVLKFIASKTSYDDLVAKIKILQPKAIYLAAFPPEARIIVDELAAAGIDVQVFGSDILAVDPSGAEKPNTRRTSPNGTSIHPFAKVYVSLPTNAMTLPSAKTVISRLESDGVAPSDAMLRAYAAVEVWWSARKTAPSATGTDLAAAIKAATIETVLGPVTFDANGDLEMPSYAFHRLGEKGYVPIEKP